MAILPIRIHHATQGVDRELAAVAHQARLKKSEAPKRAVLMLNPFGQESVRTQRLMRVAADRLARSGHFVMRFDYFGSGDSPGDDESADLAGWAQDAIAAHKMLAEFSKADEISWLGIRLGASVALMAATQPSLLASQPPHKLVLWEPVLDGKTHLRSLAADHYRALYSSFSLPTEPARLQKAHQAQWPPTEIMGFALSPTMAAQIESLNGAALTVTTPCIALLGADPHNCQASSVGIPAAPEQEKDWRAGCSALGVSFSQHTFATDFDWTSEEALNTELVPAAAVAAILDAMNPSTDE